MVTHVDTGWEREFKNVTEFYGRGKLRNKGWIGEQNKERKNDGRSLISAEDFTIERDSRIVMSDKVSKEHIISSIEAIKSKAWCGELKLMIGGSTNYRNDLWISKKYKGNRGKKPKRFKAIREWFIAEYNPIIADGCETDDTVSIMCWKGYKEAVKQQSKDACSTVLISIDKDLDQVPSYHFNYSNHEANPIWISPSEAYKCFWTQMIKGDSTDNIRGLPYVLSSKLGKSSKAAKWSDCGKVGAAYLFKDCISEIDYLNIVECCYRDYYDTQVHDNICEWEIMIQESFQLLRMQEYEGIIPDYFKYKERLLNIK